MRSPVDISKLESRAAQVPREPERSTTLTEFPIRKVVEVAG